MLRHFPLVLVAAALAAPCALVPPLAHAHEVASPELPVGDGHVTNHPQTGNVFACRLTFRGGGARHTGGWFHGDTWNPLQKPHVQGKVMWPDAAMRMTQEGSVVSVAGNGLPVNEPTGVFPISPSDPAYAYDTNPNAIADQSLAFYIPSRPVKAVAPGCLPMGMIGFTVTGVAFYNALDDAGRDAAAHEVQDLCDGHPQMTGQYHYHSASPCLPGADSNAVVGWALDGYPILGMRDATGRLLSNADLDPCHGRTEAVTVDGRTYDYAYHLTREYPYVLGCYTGQVLAGTRQSLRRATGRPPGPPGSQRSPGD